VNFSLEQLYLFSNLLGARKGGVAELRVSAVLGNAFLSLFKAIKT